MILDIAMPYLGPVVVASNVTIMFLCLRPKRGTLVPDSVDALTSNAGWDTRRHTRFLRDRVEEFHKAGIRVSIFLDPRPEMVPYAVETGADRIELYTEDYARNYAANREKAIAPYLETALAARAAHLEINAGHDLDRTNLRYFAETIPGLMEVSIGHALITDALYLGLENTIQLYLRELR